jgi:AbrB family looped-hinge helix DNA binding protein
MKTVISEKGQVTIPKALRDRLGLRPGVVLDFQEENGCLVAKKLAPQDPVQQVYGIVTLPQSTDDALRELRGEPDSV